MGFMRIDINKFFDMNDDEKMKYVDKIHKDRKFHDSILDNKYSNLCYPAIEIFDNEEKYKKGMAKKRATFYRCSLHPNIYSIHLSMLFHHFLFSQPEKHKEFITNEMFPP